MLHYAYDIEGGEILLAILTIFGKLNVVYGEMLTESRSFVGKICLKIGVVLVGAGVNIFSPPLYCLPLK